MKSRTPCPYCKRNNWKSYVLVYGRAWPIKMKPKSIAVIDVLPEDSLPSDLDECTFCKIAIYKP